MAEMVQRMDDLGRPAWIALMVVSFIVFWPIGLAVLAYMIWSGRMGCGWHSEGRSRFERKMARMQERMGQWGPRGGRGFASTGNRAFDDYREETLRRLEEEASEFHTFLERLRMAKDKAEFDQFMAERRERPTGPAGGTTEPPKA